MFVFDSPALLSNNSLISGVGEEFSTGRCANILCRSVGVSRDFILDVHGLLLTCSRVPAGNDAGRREETSPPCTKRRHLRRGNERRETSEQIRRAGSIMLTFS